MEEEVPGTPILLMRFWKCVYVCPEWSYGTHLWEERASPGVYSVVVGIAGVHCENMPLPGVLLREVYCLPMRKYPKGANQKPFISRRQRRTQGEYNLCCF